jgi:hypothetical protein
MALVYTAGAMQARGLQPCYPPTFFLSEIGWPGRDGGGKRRAPTGGADMTQAYYSAVLDHPLKTVWDLIRDFNNYPAYIEGVSESVIEDDRRGDEVGAIRRFCYLGNWVRQRLAGHSDKGHSLTYVGIEPLPFPAGALPDQPSPTRYEGTMHLREILEGNRTLIEWSVQLDTDPRDADRWRTQFQSWIPEWTQSLQRALARRAGAAE